MSAHERERLSGYLDSELSPEERAEVEAHLASCDECASRLAEMGALDGLARGLPLEVPSGYFEALPGRVRGRIEGPSRARTAPSRPRRRMPAWTWAAAAALILGVVTPLTLRQLSRDPGSDGLFATVSREPTGRSAQLPPAGPLPTPQDGDEAAREVDPSEEADAGVPLADNRPAAAAPKALEGARGRQARPRPPEPRYAPPPPEAPTQDVAAESRRLLEPSPEMDTGLYAASDAVVAEDESLEETLSGEPETARREAAVAGGLRAPAAPATLGETTAPMARKAAPQGVEPRAEGFAAEKKTLLAADADAYVRLAHQKPATADEWRAHREAWRAFVGSHAGSDHADEARVRVIEAGLGAWRLAGDPEDLEQARADAEAYLLRDDAGQKDRVRAAFETAGVR